MQSLSSIAMLVCDIDGVLTDGSIFVTDQGLELRRFHVRDGLGIRLAQEQGLMIGVISGRCTRSAMLRLQGLGINWVMQGQKNKAQALRQLSGQIGIGLQQIAFLGDDLIDLPAMRICGYPMAVADAVEQVRDAAVFVSAAPGGHGAVRQAIEHLLKAQGRWEKLVQAYDRMSES